MTFNIKSPRSLFKLLNFGERVLAHAQGKGYGTGSIRQEVKLVHQLLRNPPRLAIDIGANVGEYTAELRNRNPGLEIHMFEPSTTNIEKLKERFAEDNKIVLIPYAVSGENGSATLFSNEPGSGMSSLSKRKLDHFDIKFDFKETINKMRFEEYWKNILQERVMDIVKLDIEGHEFDAINGFGKAIHSANVLQFEFGGCNIDTKTYFQDFWYFFKDNGFNLYRITPLGLEHIERYRESDEFFITTNYIAFNCQLPQNI